MGRDTPSMVATCGSVHRTLVSDPLLTTSSTSSRAKCSPTQDHDKVPSILRSAAAASFASRQHLRSNASTAGSQSQHLERSCSPPDPHPAATDTDAIGKQAAGQSARDNAGLDEHVVGSAPPRHLDTTRTLVGAGNPVIVLSSAESAALPFSTTHSITIAAPATTSPPTLLRAHITSSGTSSPPLRGDSSGTDSSPFSDASSVTASPGEPQSYANATNTATTPGTTDTSPSTYDAGNASAGALSASNSAVSEQVTGHLLVETPPTLASLGTPPRQAKSSTSQIPSTSSPYISSTELVAHLVESGPEWSQE